MSALTSWRGYDDRKPTWSPNGDRIAFVSNRTGRWQIYTMDRHGMEVKTAIRTSTRDDYPAWSPDGKKFAYCTQRFGFWSICVAEEEGGTPPDILTNNPAVEECPAWSPDSQKIAYDSNRSGKYDIWVCNADGGKQTALTQGDSTDLRPAWSPDGKKIAFHSNRSGSPGDKAERQAIWVMDADGGNLMQLTHGLGDEISPAWSPDGSKIAFIADEDGEKAVCAVDADGSNRRRIFAVVGTCDSPVWSPDGHSIAFDANPSGLFCIHLVLADGSGHTELAAEEPPLAPLAGPPPSQQKRVPSKAVTPATPSYGGTVTSRILARRKRATGRRGSFSVFIRLLFLVGLVVGLYFGASWFLGWQTRPILVDQPVVKQEFSDCYVTYTIRNEGKGGLIRAKVTLMLDNGESVEPVSPLGAHGFRRGQLKTFTEKLAVRSDREVTAVKVELYPKH